MPETKEHWLLDTNIIIDLFVGLVCYTVVKTLHNGHGRRLCDSICVRPSDVQWLRQNTTIRQKLEEEIKKNINRFASSLIEKYVELIITSTTKVEIHRVIKRLKNQEEKLNDKKSSKSRLYWSLLPLSYIIDYSDIIRMAEDDGFIQVVDFEDRRNDALTIIYEHLRGKYDTEDWHLIAALVGDNTITAVYTEEDSVAYGLSNIAAKLLKRDIDIGNFGKFLINLRTLSVLSLEQLYTISYYAFKFQRLLHSHQMVYNVGLQQKSGSKRMSKEALMWIVYSQRRLHHYVPLREILRVQSQNNY